VALSYSLSALRYVDPRMMASVGTKQPGWDHFIVLVQNREFQSDTNDRTGIHAGYKYFTSWSNMRSGEAFLDKV
jgi:hypothetical protein